MSDNPTLRPVENGEGWTRGGFDVSGRESNPRLPDASGRSIAVELREYPRVRANLERRSRTRFCCRYGKNRWASGVIERRHSMPGIEPGPPRLSPRTVRPPYGGG